MKLNPNLDVFDPTQNAIWEIGQEGGRTRLINKDLLFENLLDVHYVFEKYKIKHWLTHGTLLGAYRDKDFITWDDDADIGADMSDRKKGIQAEDELRKLGFYVPNVGNPNLPIDPKSNMPYSDSVAIRRGEKVEIWWFAKQEGLYLYDIYRNPPELVHDSRYYDKLDKLEFRGEIFPVPSYLNEWIPMMYGKDWNVPLEGVKYNNAHGRQR